MTLPKSYLTSAKNLSSILNAIKGAQAPQKFSIRFLVSLGFSSNHDRLVVGVLKAIGFLNDGGGPTDRYHRFLDQTQSEIVLAEGIRAAYSDLFQINTKANKLAKADVVGKFKTLSQGKYSESVIDKMALTFTELCKLADFKTAPAPELPLGDEQEEGEKLDDNSDSGETKSGKLSFGGLHYNIQIVLPESRDPKVYDALFKSLRDHLK